jgi:sigma-E factor negative regulatory protein RseB
VFTVAVRHVPGQGITIESDTDQQTFIPAAGVAGAVGLGALDLLVKGYDISTAGVGLVAQRQASIVVASRQGVLQARFWLDQATGLLLRRDLYDQGTLVRSSEFTTLRVSGEAFLSHLPPEAPSAPSNRLSMQVAPSLNDEGWLCPERLPGRFTLLRLRERTGDVVEASYSDGLSRIAVFSERGSLDTAALGQFTVREVAGQPVYVQYGWPTVAVWDSGGTVYTLVSDATAGRIEKVLAAMPQEVPDTANTSERVGTGLRRLVDMVHPGG